MRLTYLILSVVWVAFYALVLSPFLATSPASAAGEIDQALVIFGCCWTALGVCLALHAHPVNQPRTEAEAPAEAPAHEAAEPPLQPPSRADAQKHNARMHAMLDRLTASSPDMGMDMRDAFLYGLSGQSIAFDPESGEPVWKIIPMPELFNHLGSMHAAERTAAIAAKVPPTSSAVDPSRPVVIGVDLAKPGAERTVILQASRIGRATILKARQNGITEAAKREAAAGHQHAAKAAAKRAKREQRNAHQVAMGAA
jgi:hypothetical protein